MGFVNTYFLNPIQYEQGYTYVNTISYAIIAFVALLVLNKFFKKTGTKINTTFLIQLLPFILIGAFLRVLVDKKELHRAFWNVSPGIYLTTTAVFLTSYIIGVLVRTKTPIKRWETVFVLGSSIFFGLIITTYPLKFHNLFGATIIIAFFSSLVFASNIAFNIIKWDWVAKPLGFIAFTSQLFDATVTSFLVQFFGAVEKHPLPRLVIETFNTGFAFFPLKVSVVLLAIYILSKEVKDKSLRNLLIISIAVLGLAQGLRNILGFIVF